MARTRFKNGLGSITKLKGNRSKPYLVRSGATYSIGEHGKQKETRSIIGYATSEEEAYRILRNYVIENDGSTIYQNLYDAMLDLILLDDPRYKEIIIDLQGKDRNKMIHAIKSDLYPMIKTWMDQKADIENLESDLSSGHLNNKKKGGLLWPQ